jgi:hypothetical protein
MSLSLLVCWIATSSLGGVLFVKYLPELKEKVEASIVTKSYDIKDFTAIESESNFDINVKKGAVYEIKVKSNQEALDKTKVSLEGNKLVFARENSDIDICLFCYNIYEVEITTPVLTSVHLRHASSANIKGFEDISEFTATLENASNLTIEGSANTLKVDMENAAQIDSLDFKAKKVDVNLKNASYARVYAAEEITGRVRNASKLRYSGEKTIKINVIEESSSEIININY